MPTYEYTATDENAGCPACRQGFEIVQSMKDSALGRCPRCGGPVRRVIGPANIATRWREKTLLSDANLKRHGFKKLVNEGGGKFGVS